MPLTARTTQSTAGCHVHFASTTPRHLAFTQKFALSKFTHIPTSKPNSYVHELNTCNKRDSGYDRVDIALISISLCILVEIS
jgi:hypothetical protein